ncbi:PREDICTED: probable tRNA pseudouridine synthase 2 [Branchiostoma belcheri]|uniref:Probable tRNA pseudouridine synthase 2 n=1 Tax=Branchiostoma belcheri TaxID=7741 RepID=A0A6P5AN39_BRABE|nr:PREDICTED: probable tRNA pseudouridine synthase 2 [Branchiostoma belcheri]
MLQTTKSAAEVASRLSGVFAVYKPPGLSSDKMINTIRENLGKEITATFPWVPHRHDYRLLPSPEDPNQLTRVDVPSLYKHPLVKGHEKVPMFSQFPLDRLSSGVVVLGIRDGIKKVRAMFHAHYSRQYIVEGRFGLATDNHDVSGKVVERTTYDHISGEKLARIVSFLQRSHQNLTTEYAGVDIQSQEAYELASQGLLRPRMTSPPLVLAMRCLEYRPPDFTLEIQCVHETQQWLRKLIHDVGLELRSTAVSTKVRRTRDGYFTTEDALLIKHCRYEYITEAIERSRHLVSWKKLKPDGNFGRKNTESENEEDR